MAVLALLVALAAALFVPSGAARADSELDQTIPAANSVVPSAPATVALLFSDRVSEPAINLVGPDGAAIDLRGGPSLDRVLVSQILPMLGNGRYEVHWAVTTVEGRRVEGSFVFTVDAANLPPPSSTLAPPAPAPTPPPAPAAAPPASDVPELPLALTRAFTAGGLAVTIGLWLFVAVCWPGGRRDRTVFGVAAAAAAVATVAAVLRYGLEGVGPGLTFTATRSHPGGHGWIALGAIAAATGLASPVLRRLTRRGALVGAWMVAVTAAGVAFALAGIDPGRATVSAGRAVTMIVHVGATSAWIGGLVGLVIAAGAGGTGSRAPLLRRFSVVATAAVAVLAASGVAEALRQRAAVDDRWSGDWGTALLLKVGLVGVTVAVGAFSHRLARTAGAETPGVAGLIIARLAGLQLVLLLGVFAATGWLAGVGRDGSSDGTPTPAPTTTVVRADQPVRLTAVDGLGEAQAGLTVFPARVGRNDFRLLARELDGTAAVGGTGTLRPFDGGSEPISFELTPDGTEGIIVGTAEVPTAGDWALTFDLTLPNDGHRAFEFTVSFREG